MTQIAKGSAEAATSTPSQVQTQTKGYKNMDRDSTAGLKTPEAQNKQAKIKAAFEKGLTLAALLNVCRAAAHLIEEDDGHFSKTVPANLGIVLKHAEQLASDVLIGLETAGAA